jgi:hypothetical protein
MVSGLPKVGWIALNPEVRSFLTNLKMLDWFVRFAKSGGTIGRVARLVRLHRRILQLSAVSCCHAVYHPRTGRAPKPRARVPPPSPPLSLLHAWWKKHFLTAASAPATKPRPSPPGAAVARRARCPRCKLACFCSAPMAGFYSAVDTCQRRRQNVPNGGVKVYQLS